MLTLLLWIGRIAGVGGSVLCAIAVLARIRGVYGIAGFQIGTVLLGGMALMLTACLCYIVVVAERGSGR